MLELAYFKISNYSHTASKQSNVVYENCPLRIITTFYFYLVWIIVWERREMTVLASAQNSLTDQVLKWISNKIAIKKLSSDKKWIKEKLSVKNKKRNIIEGKKIPKKKKYCESVEKIKTFLISNSGQPEFLGKPQFYLNSRGACTIFYIFFFSFIS